MAVSGLWFEQLTPGLQVQHATTRTVTETVSAPMKVVGRNQV